MPPSVRAAALSVVLLASKGGAQASADSSILGTWRGTSTCVDKVAFPACHDELVIYEVRQHPTSSDSAIARADKIVNGVREFMGELTFGRDSSSSWSSVFQSARYRGRWTLRVMGSRMTGELRGLPSGRQVRAVALTRVES